MRRDVGIAYAWNDRPIIDLGSFHTRPTRETDRNGRGKPPPYGIVSGAGEIMDSPVIHSRCAGVAARRSAGLVPDARRGCWAPRIGWGKIRAARSLAFSANRMGTPLPVANVQRRAIHPHRPGNKVYLFPTIAIQIDYSVNIS